MEESEGAQFGVKIGYEFFKPNNVYAEIATSNSFGNMSRKLQNDRGEIFYSEVGTAKQNCIGHFGYALQFNDIAFAPFSGLGWFSWKDGYYLSQLSYIPIGIKAQITLKENSSYLGLKFERLQYVYGAYRIRGKLNSTQTMLSQNEYGYEIAIPLTFFAADSRGGWCTSLEPYFLKMYDNLSTVGGRFAAACQF